MSIDAHLLEELIPPYLLKEKREGFVEELKNFLENRNSSYFRSLGANQWLQGDASGGILYASLLNDGTPQRVETTSIILSNTCDISPENHRDFSKNVVVAPLASLAGYEEKLRQQGIDPKRIEDKIESIKKQEVSDILFLPQQDSNLPEEAIALLDNLHTVPVNLMPDLTKRKFTLSQIGHYIFLFKISFHLCRFHEKLDRTGAP